MVSIDNELFTELAAVLHNAYEPIFVTGENVAQPPVFPAVTIVEMDNTVVASRQDSDHMERAADIMYQVDIYSNRAKGKKAECRSIAYTVDTAFANRGFTRIYFSPTPNAFDATIARITLRYRAIVDDRHTIYRR